jgi:formate dehydrogenase major subunit
MATRDTGHPAPGVTRRDFLKASAIAGAVAGCGLAYAYDPEKAAAYEYDTVNYKVTNTTCPYCSASCGQRVVVALTGTEAGKVIDIYGDFESPMNSGGLCAKGAGSKELVTNVRRIGAFATTHPEDPIFTYDPAYTDGIAYWRDGDGPWNKTSLDAAMTDIANRMMTARAVDTAGWDPANKKYNSKSVAFFGSSHVNNESNYIYRKLIANFGTSNTEHQARI